jgi:group I intron endonuclease
MVNYQDGKIYIIRNNLNDIAYIGSTCEKLSQRMARHRQHANTPDKMAKMPFLRVLNELGPENFFITLLEDCPCENKEQLHKHEGGFIRNYEGKLYNKQIPGRSKAEYTQENKEKIKEYKKKYSEINKEKIQEIKQQYYIDNKVKFLEERKTYAQENKEKIQEYKKQWYESNKETIKEKQRLRRETRSSINN